MEDSDRAPAQEYVLGYTGGCYRGTLGCELKLLEESLLYALTPDGKTLLMLPRDRYRSPLLRGHEPDIPFRQGRGFIEEWNVETMQFSKHVGTIAHGSRRILDLVVVGNSKALYNVNGECLVVTDIPTGQAQWVGGYWQDWEGAAFGSHSIMRTLAGAVVIYDLERTDNNHGVYVELEDVTDHSTRCFNLGTDYILSTGDDWSAVHSVIPGSAGNKMYEFAYEMDFGCLVNKDTFCCMLHSIIWIWSFQTWRCERKFFLPDCYASWEGRWEHLHPILVDSAGNLFFYVTRDRKSVCLWDVDKMMCVERYEIRHTICWYKVAGRNTLLIGTEKGLAVVFKFPLFHLTRAMICARALCERGRACPARMQTRSKKHPPDELVAKVVADTPDDIFSHILSFVR